MVADGLADNVALGDSDGLADADGIPVSSIKSCPALKESTDFLTSKFEPNLNAPTIPLSS